MAAYSAALAACGSVPKAKLKPLKSHIKVDLAFLRCYSKGMAGYIKKLLLILTFCLLGSGALFSGPTFAQDGGTLGMLPNESSNPPQGDVLDMPYEEDVKAQDEVIIPQEDNTEKAKKYDGNINLDDIPDEYLYEYGDVLKTCQGTKNMRLYYDCSCYAMRFLEIRVEEGPTTPRNRITFMMRGQCMDATEAAGREYNSCLGNIHILPAGTDPEKFCECYANKFVEYIEYYQPQLQSRPLTALRVRSHKECIRESKYSRY